MITAPQHAVADSVYDAVRAVVIQLLRAGEIRSDSSAGPVYFVLHDMAEEGRARELAAAPHAALYGNLAPLARAMPTASWPAAFRTPRSSRGRFWAHLG
ncbi:hypothetical protein ACFPOI_59690 [Nonomuraea angiospora]|uniref:Uncharacterized protein n=1 Tax=Nonomuraea angiospora TaxID=46172 RepID=A0ABR9LRY8_9ACTN|nr:hypothetical protein [Nonomuraea angiospora]MBE1582821.1 hypothetical protein [Nonomuraea angiospora]